MKSGKLSAEDSIFDEERSIYPIHSKSCTERSSGGTICRPMILCILIFEFCERLTFYSINANFVEFCQRHLKVDDVTAINLSLIFTGLIYFTCIFDGWISDALLGKFKMIVLSGIVYFFGIILITMSIYEYDDTYALSTTELRVYIAFGLVMIMFGTGGIKTTVGPFGAHQLAEQNENLTRLFFIWFYWFVNIGASVAFTIVVYIEQTYGFFYGFLVPVASISLALIIFLIPCYHYKESNKTENALLEYFKIFLEAAKRKVKSNFKYETFLDYARLRNGGSFTDERVNDLRRINRLIPIMLTFIPFYTAYFQLQSTYLVQGERLDLLVGNFTIPVASLNVVNNFVIIFIIPVIAGIVYPIIKKCTGSTPSPLKRIGFGFMLSALGLIAAAVIEVVRKQQPHTKVQTIFHHDYNISSMSIFWQVPQFFISGAAEVFAATTGLEFAYSQAPASQQSVITGLFYVMMGIGSFMGSVLIAIVNINPAAKWVPQDIDQGKYEFYFVLLAMIIVVDTVVFIILAKSYKNVNVENDKTVQIKYFKDYDSGSVSVTM